MPSCPFPSKKETIEFSCTFIALAMHRLSNFCICFLFLWTSHLLLMVPSFAHMLLGGYIGLISAVPPFRESFSLILIQTIFLLGHLLSCSLCLLHFDVSELHIPGSCALMLQREMCISISEERKHVSGHFRPVIAP